MRIFWICVIVILAIVGMARLRDAKPAIEPSTQPSFVLDAKKPFTIELGRGGGPYGLDIVKVMESGVVEMHRPDNGVFTSATVQFSNAQVAEVVDEANANRLTHLGRSYVNHGIADGYQWVLWIEQSGAQRAVFFSNSFPRAIQNYADKLDESLAKAGVAKVNWIPESKETGRRQQDMLWKRIERKSRR